MPKDVLVSDAAILLPAERIVNRQFAKNAKMGAGGFLSNFPSLRIDKAAPAEYGMHRAKALCPVYCARMNAFALFC